MVGELDGPARVVVNSTDVVRNTSLYYDQQVMERHIFIAINCSSLIIADILNILHNKFHILSYLYVPLRLF